MIPKLNNHTLRKTDRKKEEMRWMPGIKRSNYSHHSWLDKESIEQRNGNTKAKH